MSKHNNYGFTVKYKSELKNHNTSSSLWQPSSIFWRPTPNALHLVVGQSADELMLCNVSCELTLLKTYCVMYIVMIILMIMLYTWRLQKWRGLDYPRMWGGMVR